MTGQLLDAMLAFGVVVVVPLALPLIDSGRWTTVARAAGLAVAASFLVAPGSLAAALGLPWLGVCVVVAAERVTKLRNAPARHYVGALPPLYLVAGAGWLVIARYGEISFGFGPRIIELAAVHFHYAGFVASVWMLQLVKRTAPLGRRTRALAHVAFGAVLLATPLTAAGITFAPVFGAVGAATFAVGVALGSTLVLFTVVRGEPRPSSFLLALSASAIAGTIALAVAYSFGQWLGTPAPSIAVMAWTHGILNAFAFALCGVLGWRRFR